MKDGKHRKLVTISGRYQVENIPANKQQIIGICNMSVRPQGWEVTGGTTQGTITITSDKNELKIS